MKLKYFAWIQERLRKSEEVLPLDQVSVETLLVKLCDRGSEYASVFSKPEKICIAINGELINIALSNDYQIGRHDEVTFFPPISGG